MARRLSISLITVLASVPLSNLHAQTAAESGFYVGGRLGMAEYPSQQLLILGDNLELNGKRSDRRDFAWGIDVGYRFNRYFAMEASYLDLGEASGSVATDDGAAVARVTFGAKGPALVLVGTWPLNQWELYAKGGVFFSDTDLAFSGNISGAPISQSVSGDDEDALLGVGVAYRFTESVRVKFDVLSVEKAGKPETGNSDFTMVGLGFDWQF